MFRFHGVGMYCPPNRGSKISVPGFLLDPVRRKENAGLISALGLEYDLGMSVTVSRAGGYEKGGQRSKPSPS